MAPPHHADGRELRVPFFAEGLELGLGIIERQSGQDEAYYWHADVLGSLTAVTDDTGSTIQSCSYDAFGQRSCTGTPRFSRGFTGHEHLPSGLINMNGRIYDPELGRMISADPTIPHPHNPQSYNRYSYVMNNPLSRTDPTGFTDEANQNKQAV